MIYLRLMSQYLVGSANGQHIAHRINNLSPKLIPLGVSECVGVKNQIRAESNINGVDIGISAWEQSGLHVQRAMLMCLVHNDKVSARAHNARLL